MEKELRKAIEELIGEVAKMAQKDPLKAYVYLEHELSTSPIQIRGVLPAIWKARKDWKTETELLVKGNELFRKTLYSEIEKLKRKKFQELYQKYFGGK